MAKRPTGLGKPDTSKTHKTAKRLAAKRKMLSEKAAKRSKNRHKKTR